MNIRYKNGTIPGDDALKLLALTGRIQSACVDVIRNREVIRASSERGLTVSDEEMQQFADSFRRLMGCITLEQTLAFFKQWGLSQDDFEQFCEATALTEKLRNHLANDDKVEEYFVTHRSDLDRAVISVIMVADEGLAEELRMRIEEDGEDFHALARAHSIDESSKRAGGHRGYVSRSDLPEPVAARVFNASAGDILGPFEIEQKRHLILVEDVKRAELNDEVKALIADRIFQEWLSQFLENGLHVET